MSQKGKPIIGKPTDQDVTWQGKTIPGGVKLWPIGTDTAKTTIYSRLNIRDDGGGRYHWYDGIDDEYFLQLTAEKLVTRIERGYPVTEWQNVRAGGRNDVLDAEVYAYAAALRAGLVWAVHQPERQAKPAAERPQQEARQERQQRQRTSRGGRW